MKNETALWQQCLEWGKELLAPQPRNDTEAYRHELKYLISWTDKAELTTRISPILKLDPHATNGGYFIRSLYFDDYWNTAYEEKDAGVLLRKSTASAFIIAATAASSWNERKNSAVTSIKKLHPLPGRNLSRS